MLAATLALAWGWGRSSSLHQVMLQQRRPQQLCMRAAQVLLSCTGMQHIRILTSMFCDYFLSLMHINCWACPPFNSSLCSCPSH